MRLINLQYPNYVPLIHDLIKNISIIFIIEILQYIFIQDPLLDKVFLRILFTIIGNLVYYLIVDRYLIGAGPILSGTTKDKEE